MEYNIKNVLVTRYSNQMNSMICNKKSEIHRSDNLYYKLKERWSNLSYWEKKMQNIIPKLLVTLRSYFQITI